MAKFHFYSFFIWLTICLICQTSSKLIPIPQFVPSSYCYTQACFRSECRHAKAENKTIVALISYSFETDPYLSLYLGWIMTLFFSLKDQFYFIIHQTEQNKVFEEQTMEILLQLPSGSIYVNHERGMRSFGMYNMLYALRIFPTNFELGIIHLDSEEPWMATDRFTDPSILIEAYNSFNLVFRNYYSPHLANISVTVPAAVPRFGYIIGNMEDHVYTSSITRKASDRLYKCIFSGRNVYTEPLSHAMHNDRNELFMSNSTQCTFLYQGDPSDDYHELEYEAYIEMLSNTVFAPCPAGRNPETFRHYEALELGAIPLFVEPPDEISYLNIGFWRHYPGPIFRSWGELDQFLVSISPNEMDKLQEKVRRWYTDFSIDYRTMVSNKLSNFISEHSSSLAQYDFQLVALDRDQHEFAASACEEKLVAYRNRIEELENELKFLRDSQTVKL